MALTVRIAVWGKPEDVEKLRPHGEARQVGEPGRDYDLAEALAAFGLYEDKSDE